jgi:murein DD-endopeptidase MepM/ murein hydrolase activator NlpD
MAAYGFHPGIDYNIGSGTPIIAVSDGEVFFIRKDISNGDEVVLEHGQHFNSNYAHLSKVFVKNGQLVKRGELIALSGATFEQSFLQPFHYS